MPGFKLSWSHEPPIESKGSFTTKGRQFFVRFVNIVQADQSENYEDTWRFIKLVRAQNITSDK